MCGRYSLTTTIDRLLPHLRGPLPDGLLEHYAPRLQVRPSEPVLLQRQEHGRLAVGLALWGPGWFSLGGWVTGLVLMTFAFLLRATVGTELASSAEAARDRPGPGQ